MKRGAEDVWLYNVRLEMKEQKSNTVERAPMDGGPYKTTKDQGGYVLF